MSVSAPLLELVDVRRRYGADKQWFAIRNASLKIWPGEFVAIVGPSGSGKSSLLNVIGALDTQWEGDYCIGGLAVSRLRKRQIDSLRSQTFGFVFQSSFANPYQTTAQNAVLGLSIQGVSLDEQSSRVREALSALGLTEKADFLARTLSGGERQRLAIARAMVVRPSVILADEPTGNLDSQTGELVMRSLVNLNQSGATIVLVTHDTGIAAYADRVLRMADGVLTEDRVTTDFGGNQGGSDVVPFGASAGLERRHIGNVRRHVGHLYRAVNNVSTRPFRSIALIFAFALAFAGLVGAAGIGATASEQIAGRLSDAARDEVRLNAPQGTSIAENTAWLNTIGAIDRVVGVGRIAALDAGTVGTRRFGVGAANSMFTGTTVAVDSGIFSVLDVSVSPSLTPRLFGQQSNENVALVGKSVLGQLGLSEQPLGSEVWVNGEPYTVVGVIQAAPRSTTLLTSVVVPISQFSAVPSQYVIRTDVGYSAVIARAVPIALAPDAPGSISVETSAELRNLRLGVQTDLNGLLASLAFALLAIAVLSGASAMYLSVQSRTQELALSRALGLSRAGVAATFLLEGGVLGVAGALAGIAGGVAVSVGVSALQSWTAVAPWQTILVIPLVGLVCGAAAAVVPAVRASRVDPADAIR